jgi:hypothetical protein
MGSQPRRSSGRAALGETKLRAEEGQMRQKGQRRSTRNTTGGHPGGNLVDGHRDGRAAASSSRALTVNLNSLAFGNVPLLTSSARTLKVTNNSAADLSEVVALDPADVVDDGFASTPLYPQSVELAGRGIGGS